MKGTFARAGAVFALASLCAMLAQMGLARGLTEAEFSVFTLLFSFFSFAAMLGDAGVTQTYLRQFLKAASQEAFDWWGVLRRDLPLAVTLIAAASLGFSWLYPAIPLGPVGLVALASLAFVVTQRLTAMLRSVTQAWWVIGLQRAHAFGLLAALPYVASGAGPIALRGGTALAAIGALATAGAAWASVRLLPRGERPWPREGRSESVSFGLLLMAGALFFYGDRFVVARFCSVEEFATYSLVAVLFQVFDLLNNATNFVLAPYFARNAHVSSLALVGRALAILVPIAGVGMIGVPLLIQWGFPHFGPVAPLLTLGLAAAGVAKVLYSVLMSHFNLHASTSALRGFALSSAGLMLGGLAVVAGAAIAFGASGASLAFAGVWSLRVLLVLGMTRQAHPQAGGAT